MNNIENGINNILAAFWYNNSDEDMRALCSEVKSRISRCVVKTDKLARHDLPHTHEGDVIVSFIILSFGEYGTSPRYGWMPKEQSDFIINVISNFESMYIKENDDVKSNSDN